MSSILRRSFLLQRIEIVVFMARDLIEVVFLIDFFCRDFYDKLKRVIGMEVPEWRHCLCFGTT